MHYKKENSQSKTQKVNQRGRQRREIKELKELKDVLYTETRSELLLAPI
jgi:hypothetical protein